MKVNLNLGPEFGQGLLPFWWQSLRELGVVEIHDGIQYEGTFSRPNTIQLSDLAIFFKCYGVMASSWWDQHNIGLLVSFLRPYFMLDIKNIMKSSTLGHHLINDCTTIPLLLACNEMLLGQGRWMDFFFFWRCYLSIWHRWRPARWVPGSCVWSKCYPDIPSPPGQRPRRWQKCEDDTMLP